MAAYQETRIPDVLGRINNDRGSNPLEKYKRTMIIPDVKQDRCANPLELDKNIGQENNKTKQMYISEIKIYRRQFYISKCGGTIHTKFTDRKYHNCGHTHSSATCWGQWTAHGQFQEDEKFFGQPSRRGSGIVCDQSVAMIRVWTQLFDMDINVTKTMYKLVLF